ncbi:MAG: hypothetical protein FJ050_12405 [Cyanobacteria bacterium M_surface_7_m2_040]|nr:hypothetical protein [Cyanobacteria bacterium K_Offshore_0m_m2_072]MBM5828818.1 hypothetical protein [Cyanobacteria bacterium M_surface_7_m2_040]
MDAKRAIVAFTPLAGALVLPLVVPVLMSRVSLTASLLAAVIGATAWFVLMLRSAEMPGHH